MSSDIPVDTRIPCWKCGRLLHPRAVDRMLPKHNVPRTFRFPRRKLERCSASDTKARIPHNTDIATS